MVACGGFAPVKRGPWQESGYAERSVSACFSIWFTGICGTVDFNCWRWRVNMARLTGKTAWDWRWRLCTMTNFHFPWRFEKLAFHCTTRTKRPSIAMANPLGGIICYINRPLNIVRAFFSFEHFSQAKALTIIWAFLHFLGKLSVFCLAKIKLETSVLKKENDDLIINSKLTLRIILNQKKIVKYIHSQSIAVILFAHFCQPL